MSAGQRHSLGVISGGGGGLGRIRVEVEGAELPTFSVAAKVRVGVTVVLFCFFGWREPAVVWSGTRPQPSQLRPSPVRLFAHLAVADFTGHFCGYAPQLRPGISLFNGWPGTLHVVHSRS